MLRRIFVLLILLLAGVLHAQDNPADFIQAAVDNASPYVGQPVVYTLQWFMATANSGSTDNATIEMPDFAGFGQKSLPAQEIGSQIINGQQYQVITQQILLYPLQTGAATIAPVRIAVPETPFQPAAVLETQPVNVNILSLPDGAPDTFKNAVGQYDISAEINVASIEAGQPVTLTVTISGAGNTEQLLPPDVPLDANWRLYPNPPRFVQDTPQVGRQIFTWTVIPLQSGAQTIPPVTLTFFNPQTAQYEQRASTPLMLDVQPGNITPEAPATAAPVVTPVIVSSPVMRPLPATLAQGTDMPGAFFWLLWLIAPVLTAFVWMRGEGRPVAAQQTRVSGGSRALSGAQAQLKSALAMPPGAAFERAGAVIVAYISAKSGKKLASGDVPQAIKLLPEGLQKRVMQCLEQAEGGRYAPVTAADAAELVKMTANVLAQVDKQWKK